MSTTNDMRRNLGLHTMPQWNDLIHLELQSTSSGVADSTGYHALSQVHAAEGDAEH